MFAMLWDIFCRVIDNHGDLGVCWRLARQLAGRGQRVRLWVDDASALDWMAPGALQGRFAGVQVLPWADAIRPDALAALPRADAWVEAFGCEIAPAFVAAGARLPPPVWINLEYLSAETWVERMHGLPSPVLRGPAAGWTKWFFYPGFTPRTGGLLREPDLMARREPFDRAAWLAQRGIGWRGERLISLFCYEPAALGHFLAQRQEASEPARLLVTAGRAAAALPPGPAQRGALSISRLPYLPQTRFDHLLWACDLNLVRGEDSLVRALWAGQPFVWQLYPQHDGAHHAKLEAFLDWLDAPASLRRFHRVWNGVAPAPLPAPDWPAWQACVQAARQRLLGQEDLVSQLLGFVAGKRMGGERSALSV
jgi:uncharacterized repeat protein (TIGR03837 family)